MKLDRLAALSTVAVLVGAAVLSGCSSGGAASSTSSGGAASSTSSGGAVPPPTKQLSRSCRPNSATTSSSP